MLTDMSIRECLCIYAHLCISVSHVCTRVCVCLCMPLCAQVSAFVGTCVFMSVCAWLSPCTCYVFLCVSVCTCVYMHVYVCGFVYVYMSECTCVSVCMCSSVCISLRVPIRACVCVSGVCFYVPMSACAQENPCGAGSLQNTPPAVPFLLQRGQFHTHKEIKTADGTEAAMRPRVVGDCPASTRRA
jgi:hypothetical protein